MSQLVPIDPIFSHSSLKFTTTRSRIKSDVVTSMSYGFTVTFLGGALAYGLALLVVLGLRKTSPGGTVAVSEGPPSIAETVS